MSASDSRFTATAAASLGGSPWFLEHRVAALARMDGVTPATQNGEDWRYGRIDEVDLDNYQLRVEPPHEVPMLERDVEQLLEGLGATSLVIRVVDGYLMSVTPDLANGPAGVEVSSPRRDDRDYGPIGRLLAEVDEPFAILNQAFAPDITCIDVQSGTLVEGPIVVIIEAVPDGVASLILPRIVVRVGALAEASLVVVSTSGTEEVLTVPSVELYLGEGARLSYAGVQHLGARAMQLAYQLAEVERDASLSSFAAALGGDYARLYTRASLVGEGADSQLLAAYLGTGSQMQEFRTFQDHVVGRTKSELVFKGAVGDVARSVYSGTIRMRNGAKRAEASQTNRNLVLSEGAHADSVPNLDIEENDVRCSHASAVGPIDLDQRFYLESRGVPPEVAERLILLGFFDDLLERVSLAGVGSYVRDVVADRLAITPASAGTRR